MSEEAAAESVKSTESWHSGLSDEYRGNESLSQIPDLNTLAKSYLDAQQYAGGSIRIPGEDASTGLTPTS